MVRRGSGSIPDRGVITGLLMSIKVWSKYKTAASNRNVMKLENMDVDVIG